MARNPLLQLSQAPMTTAMVEALFPHLHSPLKKVQALEKQGDLLRLRRGLYVAVSDVLGNQPGVELCANHIYGPSYVSLHSALSYYGMIPERVVTVTSVTIRATRVFETPLGRFSYFKVAPNYYSIGVTIEQRGGLYFMIACREKALCDTIIHDRYVPSKSLSALHRYLEQDLRLDMEILSTLDTDVINACAAVGRKRAILSNLSTIIRNLS